MPLRSDWAIGREGTFDRSLRIHARKLISPSRSGFTFDTILSLLKYTAFDPKKTLPLYLAALYTAKGREIAARRPNALKWLRIALGLGIADRVKNFLDSGVGNNWSNDTYNWNKEIVVVTGGSDGIGAMIVKFLAEKGIKVAVLDIQELKFTGTRSDYRSEGNANAHNSSS
jgi:all-trans-retinol dehydrogenase (NAD+)